MHNQPLDIQASHNTTSAMNSRLLQGFWPPLLLVIGVAALLRIVFYTGYFGSDEVTYTASAYRLLDGDWSVASYVGANRYGINLPVAGFAYIFGRSEIAANLYSFLCSLAEIALIFCAGRAMFGLRVGFIAASILAFLPQHANYAGRLMADAPLALAITSSFVFFWYGEKRRSSVAFILAGLAAGLSFWIKPVVTVYLVLFLTYPLFFRTWNWKWGWMVAAFIFAVGGNSIFFWLTTGNPLFIFDIIRSRTSDEVIGAAVAANTIGHTGAGYYFNYLFIKIYHTWILGVFAVAGIYMWFVRRNLVAANEQNALSFMAWWSFGLLAVYSLFPVSINPLTLIPKQTNYMLMFVAPLALLAGYALAQFRGWVFWLLASAVFVPSFILIGMQQNVIHKFTANSKAAVAFSLAHQDSVLFGGTNATRAASFYNLTNPDAPRARIESLANLLNPEYTDYYVNASSRSRYAVIDTENALWGRSTSIRRLEDVPSCWVQSGTLDPMGFGLGRNVVSAIERIVVTLPNPIGKKIGRTLGETIQPKPAFVYRIPNDGCTEEDRIDSEVR